MLRSVPRGRAIVGGRAAALIAYFAALTALFALAAHGAGKLASTAMQFAPKPTYQQQGAPAQAAQGQSLPVRTTSMNVPQSRSRGAVTLTQGWLGWEGSRGRRDGRWREREPRNWWSDDEHDDEYGDRSYGTFRTLCVRLCDGFYWPISYATTPEHFERDRRKCESSCGSPARLFTYRNPGGELEEMEDLSGRPYSRLKTAFLYRTQFVESCKCRSDPWEQASLDRHRMYALDAARRKGDRVAGQELEELRARMDAARRTAQVTPSPSSVYSDVELAEDERTAAPQPAQSDRMSLGARPSGRSRSSAPPIMIWRHTNEQAP